MHYIFTCIIFIIKQNSSIKNWKEKKAEIITFGLEVIYSYLHFADFVEIIRATSYGPTIVGRICKLKLDTYFPCAIVQYN